MTVEVGMHFAGFLLLCMTTFAPRTIENLRVHNLTLPHENLKLKTFFNSVLAGNGKSTLIDTNSTIAPPKNKTAVLG